MREVAKCGAALTPPRSNEYGPTKTPAGVRRILLPKELAQFFSSLRSSSAPTQRTPRIRVQGRDAARARNVSRRGFEPAIKRVKIENVTFHDMRHGFASRMIARGIEPVTLAKLMGHEDIRETLNIYADLWDRVRTDETVRQAMALS
ncbi:MAG: tyrosine-type recombinase/integrase [Gaiellaceae bacterium]